MNFNHSDFVTRVIRRGSTLSGERFDGTTRTHVGAYRVIFWSTVCYCCVIDVCSTYIRGETSCRFGRDCTDATWSTAVEIKKAPIKGLYRDPWHGYIILICAQKEFIVHEFGPLFFCAERRIHFIDFFDIFFCSFMINFRIRVINWEFILCSEKKTGKYFYSLKFSSLITEKLWR